MTDEAWIQKHMMYADQARELLADARSLLARAPSDMRETVRLQLRVLATAIEEIADKDEADEAISRGNVK